MGWIGILPAFYLWLLSGKSTSIITGTPLQNLALFTVVLNHSANWERLSVLHVCKFTLCLLQYKAPKMYEWWCSPKHRICQRSGLYLKSLFLLHSKHYLSLTQPTHLNDINTVFKTALAMAVM
jgi:hypothetical protein